MQFYSMPNERIEVDDQARGASSDMKLPVYVKRWSLFPGNHLVSLMKDEVDVQKKSHVGKAAKFALHRVTLVRVPGLLYPAALLTGSAP